MSIESGPVQANTLPVDSHTGRPIPPRAQPGYYAGFDTLSQQSFWDAATREVVVRRVERVPPIQFFTEQEVTLLGAVMDRLIPQDDRDAEHRIPIVPQIDNRLFTGRVDGYRYDDMPPDGEAYRLGLQGIDAVARQMHDRAFTELEPEEQDPVLWTLHQDRPQGGDEIWRQVPTDRFWLLLMSDAVDAYYAHPYAWNEIGFGGPSYPRGYFRLEGGKPEPWEVEEQRYDWEPPPTSTSGEYKQLGGRHPHRAPAGQGGTH